MAERVTRAPRAKDSETAIEVQPDPTAVAQPDMPPAAPPTLPVPAAAVTMPAEAVVPPAKAVQAGPTIGPHCRDTLPRHGCTRPTPIRY